jgi:hypothetical protein
VHDETTGHKTAELSLFYPQAALKNNLLPVSSPSQPPPEPDFEWLIDARADIQRDMFEIYELDRKYRGTLTKGDDDSLRGAFASLVGAAFSLWRAAFLSHIARSWNDILTNASQLLAETLTTNAALYGRVQTAGLGLWQQARYRQPSRGRPINRHQYILPTV